MEIELHSHTTGSVADEIVSIVSSLTGEWFTADVAPATRLDLQLQDAVCARQDGHIRAFIMFTSRDGAVQITIMGTSCDWRGRGFGSALMEHLVAHAKMLGFSEIVVFTVPPAAKPAYQATVDFYEKRGFRVVKEHTEFWQSGALELHKPLTKTMG